MPSEHFKFNDLDKAYFSYMLFEKKVLQKYTFCVNFAQLFCSISSNWSHCNLRQTFTHDICRGGQNSEVYHFSDLLR